MGFVFDLLGDLFVLILQASLGLYLVGSFVFIMTTYKED